QSLQLDGAILADAGLIAGQYPRGGIGGGGAGGGISLAVGTLRGGGTISARGGDGLGEDNGQAGGFSGAGGGGGRIAVYAADLSGFDTARISTAGGSGAGAPGGSPGTIHVVQGPLLTHVRTHIPTENRNGYIDQKIGDHIILKFN